MPELTVDIDFTVTCNECGDEIEVSSNDGTDIYVTPCDNCLDGRGEVYWSDGYDEGKIDGMAESSSLPNLIKRGAKL
jgi:hypothetical protein